MKNQKGRWTEAGSMARREDNVRNSIMLSNVQMKYMKFVHLTEIKIDKKIKQLNRGLH